MDDMQRIFKTQENILDKAISADNENGRIVKDICGFIAANDYRRAAQATAALLISLALKSGQKPAKLIK